MYFLFNKLLNTVSLSPTIKATLNFPFVDQNTYHKAPALRLFNLLNIRNISTDSQITAITNSEENKYKLIDPFFVSGFVDAEGCFSINIYKSKTSIGWAVKAEFTICLHSKDLPLLKEIQSFFKGIGTISIDSKRDVAYYRVNEIKSIRNTIIQHFEKYPLQSGKSVDFFLFKQCVLLMTNKEHLTLSGLKKIIAIKAVLNLGLSEQIKTSFPNVIPIIRPSYIIDKEHLNPFWVTGFSCGDSCFSLSIAENKFQASFSIGLHNRDKDLLLKIRKFFNSNSNVISHGPNSSQLKIQGITELKTIVIPHFLNYPLRGNKDYNFNIWKEIVELLTNKVHLTKEGKIKLRQFKAPKGARPQGVPRRGANLNK